MQHDVKNSERKGWFHTHQRFFTEVIFHRIDKKLVESLGKDQFKFRKGRDSLKVILALWLIFQKNLQGSKKDHIFRTGKSI